MPSILGFAAMGAASVDCHLRTGCVRLREDWKAVRDASERDARMAQRGQVIDMLAYWRTDGNGTYTRENAR